MPVAATHVHFYSSAFKRMWNAELGHLSAATPSLDRGHAAQLQSETYMSTSVICWHINLYKLVYLSSKGNTVAQGFHPSVHCFVVHFVTATSLWSGWSNVPVTPPQPPDAPSLSVQIEQDCFQTQLGGHRVLLSCGCRHFLSCRISTTFVPQLELLACAIPKSKFLKNLCHRVQISP